MRGNTQKEAVIRALKDYPEKVKRIAILRLELDHPLQVSERELIESLSLTRPPTETTGKNGQISNKTMMIALQLQDTTERMDHLLTLLTKEQSDVLRGFYFEKRPWAELEKEYNLTQRALLNRRDSGLEELGKLNDFMVQVKGGGVQ